MQQRLLVPPKKKEKNKKLSATTVRKICAGRNILLLLRRVFRRHFLHAWHVQSCAAGGTFEIWATLGCLFRLAILELLTWELLTWDTKHYHCMMQHTFFLSSVYVCFSFEDSDFLTVWIFCRLISNFRIIVIFSYISRRCYWVVFPVVVLRIFFELALATFLWR